MKISESLRTELEMIQNGQISYMGLLSIGSNSKQEGDKMKEVTKTKKPRQPRQPRKTDDMVKIAKVIKKLENFKLPQDGLQSSDWMSMVSENDNVKKLATSFDYEEYEEAGFSARDIKKYQSFFTFMYENREQIQKYYDINKNF